MTKEHIALADAIREHNRIEASEPKFEASHLATLSDFLRAQNPLFDRGRWLGYIAGLNGPSGVERFN